MHRILLEHPVLDTSGLAIDGRDLKALGLEPGPGSARSSGRSSTP